MIIIHKEGDLERKRSKKENRKSLLKEIGIRERKRKVKIAN